MKPYLLGSGAVLLALAAHADNRHERMAEMEYVDAAQCHVAIDSRVLSIMPMLALAWLEAKDPPAQQRARDAFHIALKRGCDINAADLGGMHALNLAILANRADIATELLAHGADPALKIESREALFNGLDSFTLLETLEKLDSDTDRKRIRTLLESRQAQ